MSSPELDCDVVVIGAGFAGIYAIHRLRQSGFSVRAFEAGSGVGGTWYWNRYPGARCDVESLSYAYTFDEDLVRHWDWSERFAAQPEILAYADWAAERLGVTEHISFDTRVDAAEYDEATSSWVVRTGSNETRCRFLVTAVGCLSAQSVPPFPGLESFAGRVLHTGAWPHEPVDLGGLRVAVVGTGSSGIQVIPELAQQAESLTVFQRTPNYSVPARNRPLYADERHLAKRHHREISERARVSPSGIDLAFGHQAVGDVTEQQRHDILERYWNAGGNVMLTAFSDIAIDPEANEAVAEFVRDKITTIVEDPLVAEMLTPTTYPIGAKRICVDTDYYATFNLPHVALVDLRREPFVGFTPTGIETEGRHVEVDAVVLATGYDGMTGPLSRIDIRGRGGLSLRDAWGEGPKTYLGLAVHGFPNMFTITGPGSPSVLANVIASIEQHVDWIAACLERLRSDETAEIEAEQDAQEAWVGHVNAVAAQTLYVKADSWYLGANIEGKPRVFMPYPGGLGAYRGICDDVAADDYRGFVRSRQLLPA